MVPITEAKPKRPKVTKTGLNALSKSPGDRDARERKQATKAEKALARKKKIEQTKENLEKARIKAALNKLSKQANRYTGLKRLAYRVKLFWLIPDSKPKRFYNSRQAINLTDFDILKAASFELAEKCVTEYQYGDQAIALMTLLDDPPLRTRKANLAATCRQLADLVLDGER